MILLDIMLMAALVILCLFVIGAVLLMILATRKGNS